jgi:hypothetical protein
MKKRAVHGVRKLALPARIAASRFLSAGRAAGERENGWHRISQFWRREPRLSRALRVIRTTVLHTFWMPQLHLQFSVRTEEQAWRDSVPKTLSPGIIRPVNQYWVLNRYPKNARVTVAPPSALRLYRSSQVLYKKGPTVPSGPELGHAPPPTAVTPSCLLLPRMHFFQEHRRTQVLSQTERTFANRTLALKVTERERDTLRLRFRKVVTAEDLLFRSQRKVCSTSTHPLELTWRRAPRLPTSVIEKQKEELESSIIAPSMDRSHRVTTAVAPVHPMSMPLPVQPANLDPGFVDRLTDDVIRRVERRLRIERERRGL